MNHKIFAMKAVEYGITPLPSGPQVTMAYVPYQINGAENIYSPEAGICSGTMFPELNKPFEPCKCGGNAK